MSKDQRGSDFGDGGDDSRQSGSTRHPRILTSRELFADGREVLIEHEGDHYRLRCTSKGKLILTK